MTEPFLVEESTPTKLSSALDNLVKTLVDTDAGHHDYMVALIIVVMAEAGFAVTSSVSSSSSSSSSLSSRKTDPRCTSVAREFARRRLVIPADWKSSESGNYKIKFTLNQVNNEECKLLAIPLGDTLIINLVLPNRNNRKVFSIAVQTLKYVNIYSSDLAGRYLNLQEFSFKFKNEISTPARCEILSALGIVNSTLQGLSVELKFKILEMLDVYSLTRIAQTSHEFMELAGDPRIWLRLLRRDFSSPEHSAIAEPGTDYRELYKRRYLELHTFRLHQPFTSTNCFPICGGGLFYLDEDKDSLWW